MKVLTVVLVLFTTTAFGQYTYQDRFKMELKRQYYIQEGWKSLSIGLLAHGGSFIVLEHGPITQNNVFGGIMIFNLVGFSMDLRAFYYFKEARKIKKKLNYQPKLL